MVIYKYKLKPADEQTVVMPAGAEIISAHAQYGDICIWASIPSTDVPLVDKHLEIIGTGYPCRKANRRFIGTVLLHGGAPVFHVFERLPELWAQ